MWKLLWLEILVIAKLAYEYTVYNCLRLKGVKKLLDRGREKVKKMLGLGGWLLF